MSRTTATAIAIATAAGAASATSSGTPVRPELLGGLEQEVGVMVRRIRRVIAERARSVHPELQTSSYLMLTWLGEHGPQRASSMAEAFGIDKGAISRQVQHLIELGLVERTPDPDDGRASLVTANAEAMTRLEAVNLKRRAWFDARLSDWAEDDLAALLDLLGRYNAALDAS